jgi:hypothetical protein
MCVCPEAKDLVAIDMTDSVYIRDRGGEKRGIPYSIISVTTTKSNLDQALGYLAQDDHIDRILLTYFAQLIGTHNWYRRFTEFVQTLDCRHGFTPQKLLPFINNGIKEKPSFEKMLEESKGLLIRSEG